MAIELATSASLPTGVMSRPVPMVSVSRAASRPVLVSAT